MMATAQEQHIRDALTTWAPSWPRTVTQHQYRCGNAAVATEHLTEAERGAIEPFISVYAFPRGHTKENNVPRIDTMFIDFDFDGGDYDGDGNRAAWRRDLSRLLVRTRRVAQHLLDQSGAEGWRAALSGHKGVHLFVDFEPISAGLASFRQYVNGMNEYAEDLVDDLAEGTGLSDLHKYVDVTSSDLGRLCRVPNTKHGGATAAFGEDRYCVPVTVSELATIGPDKYEDLTRSRRGVPYDSREPLSQPVQYIEQYVESAVEVSSTTNTRTASVDWDRIAAYEENSREDISTSDIKFILRDRQCMWSFQKRDDKFSYGNQSHYMELAFITQLVNHNVPKDLIHSMLSDVAAYDKNETEAQINKVIAYGYEPFAPQTLARNAPEFAMPDRCPCCASVEKVEL